VIIDSIIAQYQQEFRGLVEYYRLAYNLSPRFSRLKYVMEQSLTKTPSKSAPRKARRTSAASPSM
jgi:hypothetical protein